MDSPEAECCSCSCHSPRSRPLRSVKRKLLEPLESIGSDETDPYDHLLAGVGLEAECSALREEVARYRQTIQELLADLEEERDASSSAASETMSMILRLQREKAELQMEARQFKSYAQERMAHDHEEIIALEEILAARDDEIVALSREVEERGRREAEYPQLRCDVAEKDVDEDVEERDVDEDVDVTETRDVGVCMVDESVRMPRDIDSGEIGKLSARLRALEEDREELRRTVIAMCADSAEMELLKEIARKLSSGVPRSMPGRDARVVGQPASVDSFSDRSFFEWIQSFVLWKKKASRCRYSFGLSNSNTGLLLLLDRRCSQLEQWRCPSKRIV